MAQTIKLKRSGTSGAAPTTSQLELGEVAINTYDGKMYIKKNVGGTESIVEITGGSGGSSNLSGLSDVTISNLQTDQILKYNGSAWVNATESASTAASAIMEEYQFTATSGQSTFSGSDDNSETLSYTANAIQVFLNGIFLDPSVDYTATNGTSIVLAETVDANDYLQVIAFKKKIGEGQTSVDTFTGNGSTTAFTLSVDPGDENNTRVFVDGVYQSKSNYSVSGTTLTFSTAPPADTAVEVEIGNRVVTLDTLSDLDLPDNVKLRLGTSQDLQIYHDGSTSYINETGTGGLDIRSNEAKVSSHEGETMAVFSANAGVSLRYNNSAKFATTSSGIDVTGTATMDGLDVQGNVIINNSYAYQIGGDSASTSVVGKMHNSSGVFTLASLDSRHMKLTTSNADRLKVDANGDISFYEDTGTTAKLQWLASDEDLKFADNSKAIFGAGSDLQIYHDGSNSYISDQGTGNLYLQGSNLTLEATDGTNYIAADDGVSVYIYHPDATNQVKLSTTSTGIDVTGVITTDGMTTSGNVDFGDLDMARFGVGNDLQIFHNGTDNYIKNATSDQDLLIQGNDGGNIINALSFDMSAAGAATFNSSVAANKLTILATDGVRPNDYVASFKNQEATNSQSFGVTIAAGSTGSDIALNVVDHDASNVLLRVFGNGATTIGGAATFNAGATFGSSIDVTGTVTADGLTVDAAQSNFNDSAGSVIAFQKSASAKAWIANRSYGFHNGNGLAINTTDANPIRFGTNNTERLRIDSSGNVGIGTTSPNSWASYTDSGATVLQVEDSSQRARIVINGGNGAHLDLVDYAGGTNDKHLNFAVDGGIGKFGSLNDAGSAWIQENILSMDLGSGNVGIGTTSPQDRLHVVRNSSVTNDTVNALRVEATSSGTPAVGFGPSIDFRGERGAASSDHMGRIGFVADTMTSSRIDGAFIVETAIDGSPTEKMRISSVGNVGIGTASPGAPLHVNSDTEHQIKIQSTASAGASMQLYSGGSYSYTVYQHPNANFRIGAYGGSSFIIRDQGNSSDRLAIINNGNVGIGTSSPSKAFHVYNTASADVALLESTQVFSTLAFKSSTNSSTVTIGIDGAGNAAFENKLSSGNIAFVTNLSERMRIDSAGKTKIMTSTSSVAAAHSAADELQIVGDGVVSGITISNISDAGTGTLFFGDTSSATAAGIRYNHNTGDMAISAEDFITMETDGLGIGTSSPNSIVDIRENATGGQARLRLFNTDQTNSTAQSALLFMSPDLRANGVEIEAVKENADFSAAANRDIAIVFKPVLNNAATERLRIDSNGRLLVGITSANGIDGVTLNNGGYVYSNRAGGVSGYFDRGTSDGSIVEFRKDGSSVGSIGVNSSRPYLVNSVDGGIHVGTDGYGRALLLPADQNGAPEDNLHYLGSSSYRWRDIYLSGTALANTFETSGASGGLINIIRDDPTIGTNNSLGAIYWKSTEDSGSTVNIGAGILALASQNHSTTASGSSLVFQTTAVSATSPTEKARLDSSGNLLVGTTDTAPGAGDTNTGISFRSGGDGFFSKASSYAARFNRNTNDGDVVTFAKDGANVGSVGTKLSDGGTSDGELFITSGNTGLFFDDIGSYIRPCNGSAALRDNIVDLGKSNSRFKDLWLSGNVNATNTYLGSGNEIGWGGTYSQGKPTISGSSGGINFYGAGITSGLSATITSGGNLMVGTTSSTAGITATSGNSFVYRPAAELTVARQGSGTTSPVAIFNQTGDDGQILDFRKDGTTVGSIGTYVSLPFIGKSDVNLLFDPAGPHMIPRGTSGGARDAAINLGSSSNRFKDLYLSGTLHGDKYDIYTEGGGSLYQTDGYVRFANGNTETARIDSSGNLMVGKTDTSIATQGVFFGPNYSHITSTNDTPLALSRKSSDGTILDIRKNGSTVGTIGTYLGAPYIGTGDTGILFETTNNRIEPFDTSALGAEDAAIDLGQQFNRFKNLFLSGSTITNEGVYFGSAVAANHLDDYEEGTFTPTVAGTTTAGSANYSIQQGRYTKIGRLVYYSIRIGYSSHTGAGNMIINGLPFTSDSFYSAGEYSYRDGLTVPSNEDLKVYVPPSQSHVSLLSVALGTDLVAALALDTAVTDLSVSGVYHV